MQLTEAPPGASGGGEVAVLRPGLAKHNKPEMGPRHNKTRLQDLARKETPFDVITQSTIQKSTRQPLPHNYARLQHSGASHRPALGRLLSITLHKTKAGRLQKANSKPQATQPFRPTTTVQDAGSLTGATSFTQPTLHDKNRPAPSISPRVGPQKGTKIPKIPLREGNIMLQNPVF